jgi:hypothetical protein
MAAPMNGAAGKNAVSSAFWNCVHAEIGSLPQDARQRVIQSIQRQAGSATEEAASFAALTAVSGASGLTYGRPHAAAGQVALTAATAIVHDNIASAKLRALVRMLIVMYVPSRREGGGGRGIFRGGGARPRTPSLAHAGRVLLPASPDARQLRNAADVPPLRPTAGSAALRLNTPTPRPPSPAAVTPLTAAAFDPATMPSSHLSRPR